MGLKPYDTWPKGETKEEFLRKLNARLQQLPGFSIGISQPIIDMVDDVIGGAHSPLVVRIIGDDFNELRRIGGGIVDVLHGIPGTASASIFQEPPIPQIAIDIDRAAAARYGINVSDITNLIQTGVGGAAVSKVYVADRTYDVTVRFPQGHPQQSGGAGQPGADHLRRRAGTAFSSWPTSGLQTGESTIAHEMGHRELLVRVDNRDRALPTIWRRRSEEIGQSVHFDHGKYRLEWGGQFESQQRAQARFMLIMGIVLALMAMFLFAEFGKMRQAILILTVVPLATLGGLIALHLTGETLNVASAVGFIALFGVAVQNGIIMVANINRVREQGCAAARGCHLRRGGALPAGAHDGYRGDRRHAAGGPGHRRGHRRAAQPRHRGGGRLDDRHPAHAFHPSDLLFRVGAVGGRTEPRHGTTGAGRSFAMMPRSIEGTFKTLPRGNSPPLFGVVFLALAMISGCAVGPRFKQPAPPTVDRYTEQPLPAQTESVNVPGGQAQRYVQGMDIPAQWWSFFIPNR